MKRPRSVGSTPVEPRSAIRRHETALAIGLSMLIVLAAQFMHRITGLPHDSGEYWHLASPANIASFPSHRGYFFPALLLPIRSLVELFPDPLFALRLMLAAVWGAVLPTVVPVAFHTLFGGRITLARRLIPVLFAAAIFPGALVYPLSDLPAIVLVLGALTCLARAMPPTGVIDRRGRRAGAAWCGWLLAAGFLLGGAHNTRTIYAFAVAAALAWLLVQPHASRQPAHRFFVGPLAVTIFAVGMFLAMVPQRLVNERAHGVTRYGPVTQIGARDLAASQLVWGITVQRYETSIAPGTSPMVFYLDPTGQRLFEEIDDEPGLFTVRGYLRLVAKHPLDFAGIYGRHIANGLDVRDGLGYVRKSSPLRNRTAAFNFAVLALAVFTLVACWRPRPSRDAAAQDADTASRRGATAGPVRFPLPARDPPGFDAPRPDWRWFVAMLLLPVAAIVPGAMESRFFLPLHLLAWCVIAFRFDARSAAGFLKRRALTATAVLIASTAIFFAVTLATMANQSSTWPAIYRYGPPPK